MNRAEFAESTKKRTQGLKADPLSVFAARLNRLLKKGMVSSEIPQKHTSGAKAPLILHRLYRG
jgi:hypothetical protein